MFFNVFFLFERTCCACRDEFGSCATLALDVGHLRLAKNLAGIVEWSGRNCASWHSFSDVDLQVEGFPFFRVYICTYTDTIHIPHLWPMATTDTWTCPLILQELQENKWCNLLPGAWAGSDCLQWILLKVNFAGRGKTPHAAKILPD